MLASWGGHADTVALLLDRRADPLARNCTSDQHVRGAAPCAMGGSGGGGGGGNVMAVLV